MSSNFKDHRNFFLVRYEQTLKEEYINNNLSKKERDIWRRVEYENDKMINNSNTYYDYVYQDSVATPIERAAKHFNMSVEEVINIMLEINDRIQFYLKRKLKDSVD